MSRIRDLGEDALIASLVKGIEMPAGVLVGPGDDCAVVERSKESATLLKTDVVVEGVHFRPDAVPRWVGHKALARAVSDFGAMGGVPQHALVTLLLPRDRQLRWVREVDRGMRMLASRHGITIVGGETSTAGQAVVSIALSGYAPKGRWASRSTGSPGEGLYVTGVLGGTQKNHHLRFEPRLIEGQWLVQEHGIRTMMDLSDGLAKDLPRLAEASGCGWEVETLPVRRGASRSQAWGEGEDYELLFSVPHRREKALVAAWRQRFPKLRLTRIGRLTKAGEGAGDPLPGGWDPFNSD